jgi:predicted lysophospholipase L1 biosynthesis ABC-type transport system permease subunit
VPVAILGLLALLLLFPSSILDGIVQESTAALRNAPADLVVYTRQANGVMARSRIEPDVRARIDAVPGTARVATFDVFPFSATAQGVAGPLGLALTASNEALGGRAPGPGEAIADRSLHDRLGINEGTQILLGPVKVPVTVVGFSSGSNLFFASGMVVHKSTWLAAFGRNESDPGAAAAAENAASQAVLITLDKGADPKQVAAAVDEATGGVTQTMTRDGAVRSMPGIEQQEATFGYMRAITLTVALVVVALFLSFMTLERAPLYAAMKAIGASSRQLYVALVAQVLLITAAAVTSAALITFALTRIPADMPTVMKPGRVFETTTALAVTAVVGSGLSLRRVVNVDPADAIG